ncbi:MAG: amidohydrolase family protein [Proteobacteria bacterium]|nr:amidohydrolase family protein [Pseudomonadota bacterium]
MSESHLVPLAPSAVRQEVEQFAEIALGDEIRQFLLQPEALRPIVKTGDDRGEMLADPHIVLGLADSGAHCGQICDASFSSYFLQYWVRERGAFTVEEGIRKLTSEPAELFGLRNRGVIREGAFADLNVFDLDAIRVHAPEYRNDFPEQS